MGWIFMLCLLAMATNVVLAGDPVMTQTPRGVVVETAQYKVTIADGAMISYVNKLTNEEYLDNSTDMNNVLPHLPSGLGSQHTDEERKDAFKMIEWPWWEHPHTKVWPNQHYADAKSTFAFAKTETGCTLSYTGLTNGTKRFADEVYTVIVEVDKATGDLLVTPSVKSPRGGVYGCAFTVAPVAAAVTIEAPIFDGVRLDRNMQHMMWANQWGGYWDYAFIALNGFKRGAVGVWAQDAELRVYKHLFYLINEEGLSFSLSSMNIPPFETQTEAKPLTWRFQSFDKSWAQAAARFRDWRQKNVKIAKRPDWTKQISFVNMGVNAGKGWLNILNEYFDGEHTERTVTFAATIREEGFDKNHANNTPYKTFKEDMKAWKEDGAKMMSYLQPMIMWSAKAKNEREQQAIDSSRKAMAKWVFLKDGEKAAHATQHNLASPEWQRWFLDWVKEYIQDYGSDGIYHDQSYWCPIDGKGLVNGLTSTQGMAEYFYKAASENPNSIHGTEHLTEVNSVGASLGIGSGILWGTAKSMRFQRINHASAVSNALHYPNAAIRAFPHYSDVAHGVPMKYHWGMNLMEMRGDLAGQSLQNGSLYGKAALRKYWANELWLDWKRAKIFVHYGLRPVFPEDYSRDVYTYFKGAKGEDFRYAKKPYGSAFVEMKGGKETLHYARLHGQGYAQVGKTGGIENWPVYNENGPAGLNPDYYYVFDPEIKRPKVHFRTNNVFSDSFYEGYVHDGVVTDSYGYLDLRPIASIANIITYDNVVLVAPEKPYKVWVNGKEVPENQVRAVPGKTGEWQINIQLPSKIAVLLKEPAGDLEKLSETTMLRAVTTRGEIVRDIFRPALIKEGITQKQDKKTGAYTVSARLALPAWTMGNRKQFVFPVMMPKGAKKGHMLLTFSGRGLSQKDVFDRVQVNGVELRGLIELSKDAKGVVTATVKIPLDEKTPAALASVSSGFSISWEEEKPEPETKEEPKK